jgi:hypothetical protein
LFLDPRSGIRDVHPGSATLLLITHVLLPGEGEGEGEEEVRLLSLLQEKIVLRVREPATGHENHLSIHMVELLNQNLSLGKLLPDTSAEDPRWYSWTPI